MAGVINPSTGSPLSTVGTRSNANSGGAVATITGNFSVDGDIVASLPAGYVGTLQFTRSTKATPPVKTPISGAVANAVNSLTYKIQQADAGMVIGCDSSNVVSPSNGYDIPLPSGIAPSFLSAPVITSAVFDSPVVFTSGDVTGMPVPVVESQMMFLGVASPATTALTELQRVNNNSNINHINIRQIATNSAGSAARMGVAVRPTSGTSDPRWSSRPFMKGVPQEGRPVLLAGLTNAGSATLSLVTKICVSESELPSGRIDLATSNAATVAAGTVANPTTQTTCIYTAAAGDVGKFAYPISAVSNGLGTIYYRGKAHKVRPAGSATGVLRVATAAANKPADGVFTNTGSVPLEIFQFVDVIVGSANWSQLRCVLANRYVGASNADLAPGNAVTITAGCIAYSNAAAGNSPSIRVGGSFPALADGAFDVVTDAMSAAGFGKSELMQGDRVVVKLCLSVPVGAKIPIVSAGDNPAAAQAWIYDPAATTITNKDNGIASGYTGTAPVTTILGQAIGEGFPFIVVGTQVSGDAPTDIGIGDSIFYNSVGRSMFVASHYLCEDFGMPAIAGINASRIGCTNALFDNSAYLKSMVKYSSRAILELGTNSVGATNLGNSTLLQNQDTATVALIRANAAPSAAGLAPLTVVRTRLLLAFSSTNADSSQYSAASPATQTPSARWALGGDLAANYHPWCQSQVGVLFDQYIDYSLSLRLHPDPTHPDHYRAQPGTYAYEASGVLHPTPLGGYHCGNLLRQQLQGA